jgi:predicted adenylyl cyclase CyaB
MKNIEVEIRSFITEDKYQELLRLFGEKGEDHIRDLQETWYFKADQDVRIQKNNYHSKIWLKKGQMHDEAREEIELKLNKNDFDEAAKLFAALGYEVKVKWFRERDEYRWEDIKVSLDYTQGYGYIIELELQSDEPEQEEALGILKSKLKELGVELTPKEEFKQKFNYYEQNWEKLTA